MKAWYTMAKVRGFSSAEEMLREMYRTLSSSEIARELETDPSTIKKKMKRLGLVLRPKGGNNNYSKIKLTLHRLDQRWFEKIAANKLSRYLRLSSNSIRTYIKQGRNYGVVKDRPKECELDEVERNY